ncbi:Uncharacterised protein [Serratia plymuthica]|nr:Uncharacterised protein [Serratia plymuthica]
MKISAMIENKKELFSNHEFFSYVRNTSLPLEERLSFLPHMSYFIMSFGDINKYVLPFPTPKDTLEEAINTHAKEDSTHWPWFLADLQRLHMDKNSPLTHTLQYLWSEEMSASRKLVYDLMELIAGKDAKFRLVVIEVMETTGNAVFTALSEITANSDLKLEFCGPLHANH